MNYTEYFIEQVNQHHPEAKLCNKQLHRIFNIIKMEARHSILQMSRDNIHHSRECYMLTKQINELSGRRTPEQLWSEMIKLSEEIC